MKRLASGVALFAAALVVAGCGEIPNTITPQADSANQLYVALDGPADFNDVGIFEAQALGLFKQTDVDVHYVVTTDPIEALITHKANIAISDEPSILLERNQHIALASVSAIEQGPKVVSVSCKSPKTKKSAPRSHPPLHPATCTTSAAPVDSAYEAGPTYNARDFVVTENEIITHAPILRRFIQAVARGYAATQTDPESATQNLVKLNPGLKYNVQLAGVRATLPNFLPVAGKPWGWQVVDDWNAFGTWMLNSHIITNTDATPDADTNELLAGQGV